jgi:hypothetical protein
MTYVFFALVSLAATGCFLDPEVKSLRAGTDQATVLVAQDAGAISFARDIRPLLAAGESTPGGCRPCHYASDPGAVGFQATQLDVTTLGALRKGGINSRTAMIVPGRPDQSVLVRKLEGTAAVGGRMPLGRTVWSPADIAKVRQWIQEGAVGSDNE